MEYKKQSFVDGQTLEAKHLNYMEDGIAANAEELEKKLTGSIEEDGEPVMLVTEDDLNNAVAELEGKIASGGGGTGGGAQADYLAKEGEPGYILNRDKIQEKICGTEVAFIVPEQECVFDEDSGAFMAQGNGTLTAGNTYNVTYNGNSYSCECVAPQGEGGVAIPMLGNIDALTGEGDNGMPFVIADYAVAGIPGVFMVMPLDGSESVTLSIEGDVVTPIPTKYLSEAITNAVPYYIDIDVENLPTVDYILPNETIENIKNVLRSGQALILRLKEVNRETTLEGVDEHKTWTYCHLVGVNSSPDIPDIAVTFANTYNDKAVTLLPTEDGRFGVKIV